jgi:hypothetical protein
VTTTSRGSKRAPFCDTSTAFPGAGIGRSASGDSRYTTISDSGTSLSAVTVPWTPELGVAGFVVGAAGAAGAVCAAARGCGQPSSIAVRKTAQTTRIEFVGTVTAS